MADEVKFELDQKESIKLMKMSKGYQWEIKVVASSGAELSVTELDRLTRIDAYLQGKWGAGVE